MRFNTRLFHIVTAINCRGRCSQSGHFTDCYHIIFRFRLILTALGILLAATLLFALIRLLTLAVFLLLGCHFAHIILCFVLRFLAITALLAVVLATVVVAFIAVFSALFRYCGVSTFIRFVFIIVVTTVGLIAAAAGAAVLPLAAIAMTGFGTAAGSRFFSFHCRRRAAAEDTFEPSFEFVPPS